MTQSDDLAAEIESLGEKLAEAKASITKRFIGPVSYTHLTLPTIYSV